MFDISFSELLVIAVVALIVIGPEKLPKVARTAGAFFGRMQRMIAQVKDEVNRETRFAELQKLQGEVESSLQNELDTVTQTILPPAQAHGTPAGELASSAKKPRKPRQPKVATATDAKPTAKPRRKIAVEASSAADPDPATPARASATAKARTRRPAKPAAAPVAEHDKSSA